MDFTEEQQAEIQKQIDAAVAVKQGEIDKLSGNNKKLMTEKANMAERLKGFADLGDDLDAETVKKMMDVFQSSEEAALIKDGKLDEVIARRTEKDRLAYEKKLADAEKERDSYKGMSEKYHGYYENGIFKDAFAKAIADTEAKASAAEDIIARARNEFKIEDGKLVKRDDSGNIMLKEGKPYSPTDFLKDLKESKSADHFWEASTNTGLKGGKTGNAGFDTMNAAASKGDMNSYMETRRKQREAASK